LLDLLPELSDSVGVLIDRYRGRKLADILTDIESRLSCKLPAAFEQSYRDRVAAIFDTELKPMPGAAETLSAIDVPICVASSGPTSKIRQALDLTGLSRFFGQQIFSSYDVGFWKPNPGLFLHVATKMGFAPDCCIVVEDSSIGIAAAVSAGMRPIHYLPYGGRSFAAGATVIRDLRELISIRF
jgi:HAD superfamily hydrolase (TIGR01509 family)